MQRHKVQIVCVCRRLLAPQQHSWLACLPHNVQQLPRRPRRLLLHRILNQKVSRQLGEVGLVVLQEVAAALQRQVSSQLRSAGSKANASGRGSCQQVQRAAHLADQRCQHQHQPQPCM